MLLKVICLVAAIGVIVPTLRATPLDDYVNKADPHYNYTVLEWTYRGPEFTLYLINMTSQQWLTEAEVEHPIWWHYMIVAVPDNLTRPDAGCLYISYGSNGYGSFTPDVGDEFISFITLMAVSTGTICANLRQVPNQPVIFKNDPSRMSRSEDAVIAWTWKVFVEDHPDRPEWLLRLPMTKSAVRAMDTMTDFGKKVNPQSNIHRFMVCGESKRGWTTWTTAAVDSRVVAIAPIVMDLLNVQKNLHHHYRSLGGWTFAFSDYYSLNFTSQLDNPNTKRMGDIVDPYSYIDRLTMPKYIVTTGGDEFFLPDDAKFYLNDLKGETYLRRIPNAEHSLTFHRISLFLGIQSFFLSVLEGTPRPKLRWEKNYTADGGILTFHTNVKPLTIGVQHTRTIGAHRRDFRLATADPNNPDGFLPQLVVWIKDDVEFMGEWVYRATFKNPPEGWLAFYMEATFPGPGVTNFEFCSETMIIPNTYPFPECHGADCLGSLV
ncbi:autocrine proliferation repressor protein A-like [Haliotis rubra]|uniref:autocrine proliferation repressor protein A-like n=1 Tax=Haliotis rubra TaxID=36100 RepID=UPI001EE5A086|nr:autocrine proliferation repressor protein A-like [Haliotis rubra]